MSGEVGKETHKKKDEFRRIFMMSHMTPIKYNEDKKIAGYTWAGGDLADGHHSPQIWMTNDTCHKRTSKEGFVVMLAF